MKKIKDNFQYIIFLVCSILYVLLTSISTSPLYEGPYDKDSAIFLTIGKYWSEGKLPYVELFDHKGPLIFMIDAIGFMFTGNRYGVCLLQIIFQFISTVIVYFTFDKCLCDFSKIKKVIYSVISTFAIASCCEEGNLTEEYILPFIYLSIFFLLKWIYKEEKEKTEHKWQWALCYGITFAIAVFSRITNAIGICSIVLVITIYLIVKKRINELLKNIAGFILGFALIALPVSLYFYINGVLNDMIFGTILFNLIYADSAKYEVFKCSSKVFIKCIIRCIPCFLLVLFAIVKYIKKNRLTACIYGMTGLMTLILYLNSHTYFHYYMISIPYITIIAIESEKIVKEKNNKIVKILWIIAIVFCFTGSIRSIYKNVTWAVDTNGYHPAGELVELIPEEDYDRFIAYNCEKCIYLDYDIYPCYKFFIFQEWHGALSELLSKEIYEEYSKCTAKWILIKGDDYIIKQVLDDNYYLFEERIIDNNTYRLYCIND